MNGSGFLVLYGVRVRRKFLILVKMAENLVMYVRKGKVKCPKQPPSSLLVSSSFGKSFPVFHLWAFMSDSMYSGSSFV